MKVIEKIAIERVAARDPDYKQKIIDEMISRTKHPFGPGAVKTTVEGSNLSI